MAVPEWFSHLMERRIARANDIEDIAELPERQRLAIERARREHPGRSAELRKREVLEAHLRKIDWGHRGLRNGA